MKLADLRPPAGANKKKTRKGRGIAAGKGKTAGRGTKGQNSRAGGSKGPYFEGGQLPLVRRLPHVRGFNNIYRIPFEIVNLDTLETKFDANTQVTPDVLQARGLIKDAKRVKVLGRGELNKSLQVSAHAFSDSAKEKIAAAGGSVKELAWERPPRKLR
ncbi:MAG: 50S ribosomal protein L15 [Chloroflexota bacterium]|nr:MAG: 50S ribosomal protein L15 [Chloroflexota bacterium]